jgi:parvulin-like peptidyl-prolyl isomerase
MISRAPRPGHSDSRTSRFRTSIASVVAAASVVALVAAGCGSAVRVNAITVAGTSISRTDFQRDISALSASSKLKALDKQVASQGGSAANRLFDDKGKATRVLTTSWLNRIANEIVVDHEFRNLHLKITSTDASEGKKQFAQLFSTSNAAGDPVVAQFPKWFQDQEDAREARLVAVTTVLDSKAKITDAQMRAFYDQNAASLCPSGITVSHILLKTLAQAQAVEAQLRAGAKFATLAKEKSTDTGSAANGGSLGCFATGQYVAEFENATLKAKLNVPTAPVHSQFGYHVILTTKFVPPPFESLKAQIRQQLLSQLGLVQKFVAAGLKKANVHVDPLYGTWNTKTLVVVAPKVPAVRNSRNATTTTPTT